jgi:hydrogenase nickel incorporation protein HypA/HybF
VHELGLCSSIVDAIERRAGDRRVRQVKVRVGRLHHVHPEAFDQSFAVAAMGTVAEEASAELVLLPVRGRCPACGAEWDAEDIPIVCPKCDELGVELIGGDELILESVEYRT